MLRKENPMLLKLKGGESREFAAGQSGLDIARVIEFVIIAQK